LHLVGCSIQIKYDTKIRADFLTFVRRWRSETKLQTALKAKMILSVSKIRSTQKYTVKYASVLRWRY